MLKSFDWFTALLYLVLVTIGWFAINAATYNFDDASIFDLSRFPGKQAIWFGISVLVIFVLMFIDAKTYAFWPPVLYVLVMILLAVTPYLASEKGVKGSHSWIQFGSVSIQPAEFGKFTTSLMLAWLFSQYGFKLDSLSSYLKVGIIILLPVALIIRQNETGSALVYFSLILLLYRQGLPGTILWAGFSLVLVAVLGLVYGENIVLFLIPFLVIAMYFGFTDDSKSGWWALKVTVFFYAAYFLVKWFVPIPEAVLPYYRFRWIGLAISVWVGCYAIWLYLSKRVGKYLLIAACALGFVGFQYSVDYAFNKVLLSHQRGRIEVLLGLKDDPKGVGYNVNQAEIAIGSGGVLGKGYLEGTQTKLSYVPEQHTDFIFCTIGEEQGFIGSSLILILYAILIIRIIMLAERQQTPFAQVYAYCVACIFFFHVAINVGMVIGLVPVIGIPLPFLSYGGSSMLSFTILLWILLKLDASRNVRY